MWLDGSQQLLLGSLAAKDEIQSGDSRCRIWDPKRARISDCFLPLMTAFPVVVASFFLTVRIVIFLSGICVRRPAWTRPFVEEAVEETELPLPRRWSIWRRPSTHLLLLSFLGLLSQILFPAFSGNDITVALSSIAWVLSGIMVAIIHPRTAPIDLLAVYISILLVHLVMTVDDRFWLPNWRVDLPTNGSLAAAILAVATILRMPFRDPLRPKEKISPSSGPPTSRLRSPEDNLTLWQFLTVSWMAPMISLGKTRQLHDEDVWSLSYEFQHKALHERFQLLKGSLLRRLLQANGIDLILVSFLGAFEQLANLLVPVLLQQLLRSMEDSHTPKSSAATYAVLILVARFVASQTAVLNLWYCRRCYERSRGEMIMTLYQKTLSRKIILNHAKQESPDCTGSSGQDEIPEQPSKSKNYLKELWNVLCGFLSQALGPNAENLRSRSPKAPQSASIGKILNLMRNDVYEVAQRFWEFPSILTKPTGVILSVVLIWKLIGWPCLAGIIAVVIAQILNAFIARLLLRWERVRRATTDTRLQRTSQFVEAIRHLRWYGWQDAWLARIMEARQHELNLRIVTSLWNGLIVFTNVFASGMFPVAAFFAYTKLAGLPLRIDIAFPALQLFGMLETNLRELPGLITVLLNARIALERLEEFIQEPDKPGIEPVQSSQIELRNASFSWPGTGKIVLRNISLTFSPGLNVIFGNVAAGKTALLQALLGEMDRQSGEYMCPTDVFGYCAQNPWLQSASIRDNILFSLPYEEPRYKQVLDACALTPDLAAFTHGDLTNIGENGIGLSGGQRARVALARAVYSKAEVLLLDDPLSGLDYQTAVAVVEKCLNGPLTQGRIVVLVTHRTELCQDVAQQVVEIADGRAIVRHSGTSTAVHSLSYPSSAASTEAGDEPTVPREADGVADKFIEDEKRAHGGIKASIYWTYIRAGRLRWWFLSILVVALSRLINVGQTYFLKEWGEAYKTEARTSTWPTNRFPSPEVDVRPWLIGFFIFAVAQAVVLLIMQGFMLVIVYTAGRRMFKDVMQRVAHATFRFYDTQPVGRLMNRLTSDIGTIDGNISGQFQAVVHLSIVWISSIIVIASVTPPFVAFSVALTVCFVLIFLRFLPTSQSLRRLEMVSLSPLMSNFGTLLEGLTTVRAFRVQRQFQDRLIEVVDAFQKMDHFYWSLQAWLQYRFDNLSAVSTLLLTLLALYTGVSPGLTAFVLISASTFVTATHSLCRVYGQLQMDFVSVERVIELLHLQQEPQGTLEPPAWWPSSSAGILFEDVTSRYAPGLDPSLSNISLRIQPGSNTAIIGRTGSGKSTLALSLLATVPPESGRILIDNLDISAVNKQALRERVTFLAQDPVLFPGTMRANLDPLNEYSDEACADVLAKICGKHKWTLDTHIDTGGKNLSQGERQLVGLARALLRRSPIVILDEATASIDTESAVRIQEILREEMSESTVITIAHRLEAVRNADHCVVLSHGRVIRQGTPQELLAGGQDFAELLGG